MCAAIIELKNARNLKKIKSNAVKGGCADECSVYLVVYCVCWSLVIQFNKQIKLDLAHQQLGGWLDDECVCLSVCVSSPFKRSKKEYRVIFCIVICASISSSGSNFLTPQKGGKML